MKSFFKHLSMVALAVTAVSGCSMFDKKEQAPLPGERISVLLNERSLSADKSLAGVEILLPPPFVNSEWPQSGGYPNHAMHHLYASDLIQKNWSTDIGSSSSDETRLIGTPIVAANAIFTLDAETTVSAFEEKSGKRIWRTELTPDDDDDGHMAGGIAYEGGRLFITTGFAQVISLSAIDGTVQWKKNLSAPMRSAPTVRGGRVFTVTIDNKLYALNAATGETLWDHTGITEGASLLGGASPAVDSGIVIAPYTSGELVALSVDKGRILWQDTLSTIKRTDLASGLSQIRGNPIIDRGKVFAISHSGIMAAIDIRTGRRLWDNKVGGMETPWVAGDYLFVITNDAEIVAISRDDGRILWVKGLPKYVDPEEQEDRIIWTGPVLVSDRLLVAGSNNQILSISPYSGDILGSDEMPDGVSVAPVVANGRVYFLANDAKLVAYQ